MISCHLYISISNSEIEFLPHKRHDMQMIIKTSLDFQGLYMHQIRHVSLQYKKRLLLRCIHHFDSDLINNMDHMLIDKIV